MKTSKLILAICIIASLFNSCKAPKNESAKDYSSDLEQIFGCSDQSILVNNKVATYNPIDHGWEHFTETQSIIGRVLDPGVLVMNSGFVYTGGSDGILKSHFAEDQKWLPWLYTLENKEVEVKKTVTKNVFIAKITVKNGEKGLLILEFNDYKDAYYRSKNMPSTPYTFVPDSNKIIFNTTEDEITAKFRGNCSLSICQEPTPLMLKFQGKAIQINQKSVEGCWKRNGSLYAGIEFTGSVEFVFSVNYEKNKLTVIPSFEEAMLTEKQRWEDIFTNQVPPLKTKDKQLIDTYYLAWWSILSNRCDGREGILSHPFTMTSAFMYPWQFFWDECYHSVLYGNLNDKEMPYAFLKNFIPVQFPNGGIPFSINSMSTEEYWKRVKTSASHR